MFMNDHNQIQRKGKRLSNAPGVLFHDWSEFFGFCTLNHKHHTRNDNRHGRSPGVSSNRDVE